MGEPAQAVVHDSALAAELRRDRPPALEGEGGRAVAQAPHARSQRVCSASHIMRCRAPAREWSPQIAGSIGSVCSSHDLLGCLESSTPAEHPDHVPLCLGDVMVGICTLACWPQFPTRASLGHSVTAAFMGAHMLHMRSARQQASPRQRTMTGIGGTAWSPSVWPRRVAASAAGPAAPSQLSSQQRTARRSR